MNNYEKPMLQPGEGFIEKNEEQKERKGECPKANHPYAADWTCSGCEYCVHQEGWSWLNDRCSIA